MDVAGGPRGAGVVPGRHATIGADLNHFGEILRNGRITQMGDCSFHNGKIGLGIEQIFDEAFNRFGQRLSLVHASTASNGESLEVSSLELEGDRGMQGPRPWPLHKRNSVQKLRMDSAHYPIQLLGQAAAYQQVSLTKLATVCSPGYLVIPV